VSSSQASGLNDHWPFLEALYPRAAKKKGEAVAPYARPDRATAVTAETIVAVLASTSKGPATQKVIDRAADNIPRARGEMEVAVPREVQLIPSEGGLVDTYRRSSSTVTETLGDRKDNQHRRPRPARRLRGANMRVPRPVGARFYFQVPVDLIRQPPRGSVHHGALS
jgi:hypothetical protein